MEVNEKVAVVTGAAAGIGRAIAKRLAKKGAYVVVVDIDADWGREAVGEIRAAGGQAAFANFDVSSDEGVQEMIGVAVSRFGGLHILVNNAFMGSRDHFPDAPPEKWSRVLDVALRGTMLGIQYGITEMKRSGYGAIVNVSSVAGLGSQPHSYPEYAAAKAAVIRLTECLAPLAAERNIRINCIAPDWTETEFVRERFEGMTTLERAEARDGFGRPPPARFLKPEEVAAGALELISDDTLAGRTLVMWCGEPPRLLPDDRWE
ncbi:MAG TPA: SDR family oxidoreductase [Gaiellaceae bacterium]|nr:SDR family oxidoreductase [Gaiellaceae bacterium]